MPDEKPPKPRSRRAASKPTSDPRPQSKAAQAAAEELEVVPEATEVSVEAESETAAPQAMLLDAPQAQQQSVQINPLAGGPGTGTPPTSPNFAVPRWSSADAADGPTQMNAITDTFDAAAAKRGAIVDADIASGAAINQAKIALAAGMLPQTADVKMTAAATAPAGWLLCDGSTVSRTTYAALFAAIGVAYGVGNNDGLTFSLPNLQGRFPIGVSGSTYQRGTPGGETSHTLTAAEQASMTVNGNNEGGDPPGGNGAPILGGATSNGSAYTLATIGSGSFGFGMYAAGGGGAHNNLPPFLPVNFLIKT